MDIEAANIAEKDLMNAASTALIRHLEESLEQRTERTPIIASSVKKEVALLSWTGVHVTLMGVRPCRFANHAPQRSFVHLRLDHDPS